MAREAAELLLGSVIEAWVEAAAVAVAGAATVVAADAQVGHFSPPRHGGNSRTHAGVWGSGGRWRELRWGRDLFEAPLYRSGARPRPSFAAKECPEIPVTSRDPPSRS